MPKIQAGAINLNYDTYGEGEPLLLIMGFGMPGVAWLPSLPMLKLSGHHLGGGIIADC